MNTCFRFLVLCGLTLAVVGLSVAQAPDKSSGGQIMYFDAAKVNASFEKGGPFFRERQTAITQFLLRVVTRPGSQNFMPKIPTSSMFSKERQRSSPAGKWWKARLPRPMKFVVPASKNGPSHKLAKGDVIIVPNNTPHQFVDVNPPFLYFVVKVK